MEFSGEMRFKIILKVRKKTGFHHRFRRYIFRKTTGEGVNLTPPPPPPNRLGLNIT